MAPAGGEVGMETPGGRTARRSVTLRDVAAAARVHVATASRALDAETAHPVSPQTRARVQQVAEELGYRPNAQARALRRAQQLYAEAGEPRRAARSAFWLGFHLGNTVKYVARAGKKDPSKAVQDLEKARWYLDREIRRRKAEEGAHDGD